MDNQRNNTATTLDALKPLITENYRARAMRELPDNWFWADELAIELGANSDYYDSIPKWYELND